MKNSVKILAAFAAGAAAGAILGILFAPDKGSETRKKIADKGKKLTNSLEKQFSRGREKVIGLKNDVKEKIVSLTEKVEENI